MLWPLRAGDGGLRAGEVDPGSHRSRDSLYFLRVIEDQ
jgi:hypothetical protein